MRAEFAAPQRFATAMIVLCTACGGAPYGCEPAEPLEDDSYSATLQAPDCRGNNDGTITFAEMPFVPGAVARIRVQEGPVSVDTAGFDDEDGVRRWDFSTPAPESQPLARIQLDEIEGHWFRDQFPLAQYAGPLVPGGALLGALLVDEESVRLFGSASAEENPPEGKTLIVYDVPVVLYPFPLSVGSMAVTRARASNAIALGLTTAFDDRYTVEVTGRGTVVLPDLVLENTLRVTIRLERTALVGDARQVTHVFVHECLGEVARIISPTVRLNETMSDSFTTAQQVWRLSL